MCWASRSSARTRPRGRSGLFFFSSRRRHTRSDRDWSSDVCSSDLVAFEAPAAEVLLSAHRELEKLVLTGRQQRIKELLAQPYGDLVHEGQLLDQIGRASCRERV